jgi:hypothetical protein
MSLPRRPRLRVSSNEGTCLRFHTLSSTRSCELPCLRPGASSHPSETRLRCLSRSHLSVRSVCTCARSPQTALGPDDHLESTRFNSSCPAKCGAQLASSCSFQARTLFCAGSPQTLVSTSDGRPSTIGALPTAGMFRSESTCLRKLARPAGLLINRDAFAAALKKFGQLFRLAISLGSSS